MPPDTFVTFTPDPQDPSWRSGWDPMVDLAKPTAFRDLPQSVFLWRNFQVKVVFTVGGVDLSQSMGVPVSILDFVLMLQAVKVIVRREGRADIGLSDRGDQWSFSQHGELLRVRIRGLLDDGWVEGSCLVEEFEQLVDVCLADALRLMFWEQPALRQNTYLQTLVRQAAGA
ncbi:hypothetical protein Ato02nite_078980 [Paractinoplanes toevensis]|uniref:Uncharacterized protein n=2 Tax=Paractinoplanes toevensis TaxID=571911 RepID=A0A920BPE2_9ACTN|nr:hypothetical protein Ato02nite_078980 [Actinoplanes toevensis]